MDYKSSLINYKLKNAKTQLLVSTIGKTVSAVVLLLILSVIKINTNPIPEGVKIPKSLLLVHPEIILIVLLLDAIWIGSGLLTQSKSNKNILGPCVVYTANDPNRALCIQKLKPKLRKPAE